MKNYILMLGVAGVALGSYCAYAGNSATMTVTATIANDVSLSVTQDLDLGTITINPAYDGATTKWNYNDSGSIKYTNQGAIVSADNATFGTFTANIPNPTACINGAPGCGGLSFEEIDLFGRAGGCGFVILYSGSDNIFNVIPGACAIQDISSVTTGEHEGTLTISYTAS